MPDSTLIITELFGACALAFNLIAYRQSAANPYRIYSGIAMLFLAIHFFRIEAYAATIGCSLAVVRNMLALKYNGWYLTLGFVIVNLASFSVEWFYFNHGLEIIIAYSASLIFTIGTLRLHNILDIRRWFTLAEGLNLAYAIIVGSLFGSIYSLFNLAVLLVFWWRYYQEHSR